MHTNDNVTGRACFYTSPIMHWNTKTGRKALARTQPRKVLLFCKVQGAIVVTTVVTTEPLLRSVTTTPPVETTVPPVETTAPTVVTTVPPVVTTVPSTHWFSSFH